MPDRRLSRRAFLQYSAGSLAAGAVLSTRSARSLSRGPRPAEAGAPVARLGYPGFPEAAVFGAELQYFRMSPSAIPARLSLCSQAHYGIIQTYVPWNVHESEQGTFDFTGKTSPTMLDDHFDEYQIEDPLSEYEAGGLDGRLGISANTNLVDYLQQVHERGFKMVLRPGPFISDEWANGGLPYWLLFEGAPSMFVDGPEGSSLGPGFPFSPPLSTALGGSTLYYFSSPSYAASQYMSAVDTWLATFTTFLLSGGWLTTQGGPVAAVQVDDESCFFYRFGTFEVDYNPAMLRRWALYSGGQPAPRRWPSPREGVESLRPIFEWQKFKSQQVALYLGSLASSLTSAGLDVPINHELEQHMLPPTDLADVAKQVILNGEYYDSSDAWNLPVNEINAQSIRAASRQQRPTYATEMDNGDTVLYNLLLGEGIYGGLQFTYTEGVADGYLEPLAIMGRTFETAGRMLSQATRRADVAIVWDQTLCRAPYRSNRWGFTRDVRRVIEHHVGALATLLIRAGYAFDLIDVEVAEPSDLRRYPTVFLAAADICPRPFQSMLVDYVDSGGRLVCWPAPPTLDENLDPCTTVLDALYPEPVVAHDPTDGALVTMYGVAAPTWLGVDHYELSSSSSPIAVRDGAVCGYSRSYGDGSAVLLGTWLVADSVMGREGTIIENVPVPAGDPAVALAQLAASKLSSAAAGLVPDVLPGGQPQQLLVLAYTNDRRGGETIASGVVGYWDGENVVGVVEENTDINQLPVQTVPYHPILPAHIALARLFAGVSPRVVVDSHLQARVLDGPDPGSASLVIANRWLDSQVLACTFEVDGETVRLPMRGTFTLPGSTGLILPVNYPLGLGRTLVQATAQLLGVISTPSSLVVDVLATGTAEVVLSLEKAPTRLTLNGAAVAFSGGRKIKIDIPAGEDTIVVSFAP